ncbi:MAG: hypothetical protein IT158_02855 [Bryobacterales bacterium]|nr:hypothetical protein [Bryobacterales bacterium]
MIDAVSSNSSAATLASQPLRPTVPAGEVFSVSLDSEMLGLLTQALSDAGIDPSRLRIERQEIAGPREGRQFSGMVEVAGGGLFDPGTGAVHYAQRAGRTPGFEPRFMEVYGIDPAGNRQAMNPLQFATKETAERLAAALGANGVTESNLEGPYRRTAPDYSLDFGSVQLSAGLVADLYNKYPKEVADAIVGRDIALSRGEALPEDTPPVVAELNGWASRPAAQNTAGSGFGTIGDYRVKSDFGTGAG